MDETISHNYSQGDEATSSEDADPSSILLLYSVVDTLQRGEATDIIADEETSETARSVSGALEEMGYSVTPYPIKKEDDVASAVSGFDPQTTLIFNLCETLGGYSTQESRVPFLLRNMGYGYVGAPPETLDMCLDKSITKARLLQNGVPTAPYQVFITGKEKITVPLPAIVKPVAEDCSLGITKEAVVTDIPSLYRQVDYILRVYEQPAMVEIFLNGREFSISLWGNGVTRVLAIAEVDYSNCKDGWPMDDFESKWCDRYHAIYPAIISRKLERSIGKLALDAYAVMGCRDYARVDIREKDGELYVLDVNPNPGLSISAGFARAARVAGYDYPHMVVNLVRWAWHRHGNLAYAK